MTGYESRSSKEKYLVGQIRDNISELQLATNRDVLKYLFFKKHEAYKVSKKNPCLKDLISCPTNKLYAANCGGEGGCQDGGWCVVRAVKQAWKNAGIQVIQDRYIR